MASSGCAHWIGKITSCACKDCCCGIIVRTVCARRLALPQSCTQAYFDGDLVAVASLPTATNGTNFQRAVWDALRHIAPGETISYGMLANRIGRPSAMRAVGLATGANPIAIVVPCHRVIGANGTLTGYGGGLERKRWLLAHERASGLQPDELYDRIGVREQSRRAISGRVL